MTHTNELKIPKRRLSTSSNERRSSLNYERNKMQDIKEYKTETIPENEEYSNINSNYTVKKVAQFADSRSSKETLSNIGIDNTYRKGSLRSYSEVSSSFNRDQRKNTVLK